MSKRKKKVLSASFLAAAFAVALGFAIQAHGRARYYERLLSNSYSHALYELTTASEELTAALQKASYTTPGPLQENLYQQIYAKALTAQYALGEIPMGNVELEQTASFFAKTGDYAIALCRDGGDGRDIIPQLAKSAQAVTAALYDAQGALEGGGARLSELSRATQTVTQAIGEQEAPAGGSAFQTVEADFPEIPSLIYDGPFSEHMSSQTPKALEGSENVSEQEAKNTAASFLCRSPAAFTTVSSGQGILPTYAFSLPQEGGTGYIEVTRQGGQILNYFQNRTVGNVDLTPEEGIELAKEYLSHLGMAQMAPSYYLQRDGALTIHFAPLVDGVYCYPDLVKVTIALDNGTLLGYEAHGYLSQHTQREFLPPAVSQEYALSAVPESLEVLSSQLALIPTGGGTDEVLTYEFKCRAEDGSHVLVYVNAQTGQQQNILLLLEDETGTLTL